MTKSSTSTATIYINDKEVTVLSETLTLMDTIQYLKREELQQSKIFVKPNFIHHQKLKK